MEELEGKYFAIICLVGFLLAILLFVVNGMKAIRQFSDIDPNSIIYSEKWASGHSLKSFITKYGGANKVLHIIITDKELIIKTGVLLAFIANIYDLLHRIPLKNIEKTERKKGLLGPRLHVHFTDQTGKKKEIVLMSKNMEEIEGLLHQSMEE